MDLVGWTELTLGEDLKRHLTEVPAGPGVGVLRGPEDRALLAGAPSNLRRWAASQLGLGKAARPGKRPKTNLRGVARSLSLTLTRTPFHQRLTFERVMSREFPGAPRRDLKPPFYLRLDLAERFPRVRVVPWARGSVGTHGPFRDRRAAALGAAALQGLFPLRPCDYTFEPDPALALGLGCLFAQVATCPAPCLAHVPEAEYRALAARAHAFLADPDQRREPISAIPAWATSVEVGRALVAEVVAEGVEICPVSGTAVLDNHGGVVRPEALASAIAALSWDPPDPPRDDSVWLSAWLHSRKRTGAYVAVGSAGPPAAAARIGAALGISAT